MWSFHTSKAKRSGRVVKRLVTGLIIGGAIGSVIGKRLLDKHEEEMNDDEGKEDS